MSIEKINQELASIKHQLAEIEKFDLWDRMEEKVRFLETRQLELMRAKLEAVKI